MCSWISDIECEDGDIVMTVIASESFLGPIEVCVHNKWHRLCDSNWTKADAITACRQLELPHTGIQGMGMF